MNRSRIVAFQERNRAHYHLRGCGLLRPLTEGEARRLRRSGVGIELPDTMPLTPPEGRTAVGEGGQDVA